MTKTTRRIIAGALLPHGLAVMAGRTLALTLMGAAVITSVSACQTSSAPAVATTVSGPQVSTTAAGARPSSGPSPIAADWSATPTVITPTQQPCDLLTEAVAKKYVGDNAQRQLFYDATPPVAVGNDSCLYRGDTRSVSVAIFPRPSDPSAPVNHFDVIRPENRVDGVGYEAYWFAAAESLVAVKGPLLIVVKVSDSRASQNDAGRTDEVELANLVVPQVS